MSNLQRNIKEIQKSNLIYIKNYLRIFYNPPTYEKSLVSYNNYLKENDKTNPIRNFKEEFGFIKILKNERIDQKNLENFKLMNVTVMLIVTIIFLFYYIQDFYNSWKNNIIFKWYIDLFLLKNSNKVKEYKKIGWENDIKWLKYSKNFIF